jgi:hypothetical protein
MSKIDWDGYIPNIITPSEVMGDKDPNCSEKDFIEWASHQRFYRNAPFLKTPTEEFCAKFFLGRQICDKLEHGKYYTRDELGLSPKVTKYNKLQFIIEEF